MTTTSPSTPSSDQPGSAPQPTTETPLVAPPRQPGFFRSWLGDWFTLRKPAPIWEAFVLGVVCILLVLLGWWAVTRGPAEERTIGPLTLPSPYETFSKTKELFIEFEIITNTLVTLRRVALGFLLAIAVGVPLGVVAGCYPRFNAFLSPLVMFGRNIPLAAVLPLLIFVFSGEQRKVMFIFIACVAFVIADTAQAIADVATRYIDTAYTLGASRWQTIIKVLVPLAMPTIFGSFRVLFGLAFGYIMLAESIRNPGDVGGLGFQINTFQRRNLREHIYLIIILIPLVALAVDMILFWIQRQLFSHVYGGAGLLQRLVRLSLHAWDDLKHLFFHYEPAPVTTAIPPPAAPVGQSLAPATSSPPQEPPKP
jgi:ABC-type nitrate/sulfonate/bicarbonate transport system permease component